MEYAKHLERLANESVWMPAKINMDGTISNALQVYVKVTGAEKGESNFKKSQRPVKHGYKKGCDLGTYVMNMHVKYEPVSPLAGETKDSIVDGARLVRLGRYVKRSQLSPQDRIFAESAKLASIILERKAADQSRGAESEQSGSLSGKRPDA